MNNLLKLRLEQGLSRPDLEKLSGVPASTIHKLEIGANDMRGAKSDTLYKLAHALNTTVEHLLQYYLYQSLGVYAEAELKCIVVLKDEWKSLKWESTDITLMETYNGKYIQDLYGTAKALGYKPLAKLNTLDYCYEKDGEIVIFRGPGNVIMARLPKTLDDVRENDGLICNGMYISINSYEELPK